MHLFIFIVAILGNPHTRDSVSIPGYTMSQVQAVDALYRDGFEFARRLLDLFFTEQNYQVAWLLNGKAESYLILT